MQKLVLPIELFTSLNKVLDGAKKHWSVYSKAKKKVETAIAGFIRAQNLSPVENYPVVIIAAWFTPSSRGDPDNWGANKKFYLDALKQTDIIRNDGQFEIVVLLDYFPTPDKQNPRVEILIMEDIQEWITTLRNLISDAMPQTS